MSRVRSYDFARDERGAGTIMGLLWFMLLVGITGMAVDVTNGFRNRTMLQATADAAALGGIIDVLGGAAATTSAVAYSTFNMPDALYGDVLLPEDVEVGSWDMATRTFIKGGLVVNILDPDGPLVPDAVLVTLHQTVANTNAVPVNFLRIVGLQTWDVNVEAVAQRFLPDCVTDGLLARGVVDISSNNNFVNRICIHGQWGVEMQNHNYIEYGVNVSMPDIDGQLIIPTGGMESNPGLDDALREQSLDPRMVNHVDGIMAGMLNSPTYVMPNSQTYVAPNYIDTSKPVIVVDSKYDFVGMQPHRVYHVQCKQNNTVSIPSNTEISKVVIIADCQVSVGSNVFMHDVVLASRAVDLKYGKKDKLDKTTIYPGEEKQIIKFSSNVKLGTSDNCNPGGGVQIFSNASIHFSSTTTYNGVQIVAAGDVELGARDMGINGINVKAGGRVDLTSNNAFGICSGGAPNLQTAAYYRLVR